MRETPVPNTSSYPVAYCRAMRSRPSARRIASSRVTVGVSLTSCSATRTCTLPGFNASSSARQAARKARSSTSGATASVVEGMAHDGVGDVVLRDALQAFPGRHRVDLEHHELAGVALDEVDAGIGGA